MCRVGVLFGDELTKYSFGPNHPMNSERIIRFYDLLKKKDISNKVLLAPEKTTDDVIGLFHRKEYIEFVKKSSESGEGYLDYGDTPAFKGVYEASAYVVGSTIRAFDEILSKKIDHGFNPMGGLHHARRNSAAGFCVFNDVGILIEYAKKKGIRRILYIDIDAHHGDGVYYEYEEDPELFILDFHEDGRFLYPGTGFEWEKGRGAAKGTKINVPLMPESGDEEFLEKLEECKDFLNQAKPDLIIVQCGGDALSGDPITHLNYTSKVHRETIKLAHELAHRYADGKLIILGGGGYNPESTAKMWLEVVSFLSEHDLG